MAGPTRLELALQQLGHLLTLAGHSLRRLSNPEGEQSDCLHQPEQLVFGAQMPEIQHALVEVLALAWLEQRGDRLEEVFRRGRGGWPRHGRPDGAIEV